MRTDKCVTVVTDLGFGDAGKGSVTDYLARAYGAGVVVRFNGGAQAGHNVVTADGRHHAFHQFGSASFVAGSQTHLSRFMLVNPLRMWEEAHELAELGVPDALRRMSIDENALVVSPYQEAANRIRETLRGAGRHGSCGHGVGETMADSLAHPDQVLTVSDLNSPSRARRKLEFIRELKLAEFSGEFDRLRGCHETARDIETFQDSALSQTVVEFYTSFCAQVRIVTADYLGQLLRQPQVIFEGAQGVLLDEWYGFHPYTTWSTTTNANADQLLREQNYDGTISCLGLLRSYATRHGAGPLVTEDARLSRELADPRNPDNPWQHGFRIGHFDLVATRYALDVVGRLDGLVLSHLDQLDGQTNWRICTSYTTADGQRLASLQRSPTPNLDYQTELTEKLLASQPCLEQWLDRPFKPEDRGAYIEYLEGALGLKVVLGSAGLTAADKYQL